MIRVCLIGAGRMGRDHAKHISRCRDAELYCVVDANPQAARQVAELYQAKTYANFNDALNDPQVDAVVIVTPTSTHAQLIIQAARAGKPVFCEKPIDLELSKIDECLDVIEETGVPFFVAFQRRFDPSFEALKHRIDAGEIGPIEQITLTSRDFRLPDKNYLKTSGLLYKDMTIHDFDMARWLLGEEPVEVFATGSTLVDPSIAEFGDIDTTAIILRTARGAIVQISNSRRCVWGYDQRIEVSGPHGMLRAENLHPTTVQNFSVSGMTIDCPYENFPQRHAESYQREMDHFFSDVVKGGQAPRVTGADGRQAIVIAEAAVRSLLEKRPIAIAAPSKRQNALASAAL